VSQLAVLTFEFILDIRYTSIRWRRKR